MKLIMQTHKHPHGHFFESINKIIFYFTKVLNSYSSFKFYFSVIMA
jgi:hypothetical protein